MRGNDPVPNWMKLLVLKRDGWNCLRCGVMTHRYPGNRHMPDETTFDHVIPVSAGGETSIDNLQILCWTCNRWKGALLFDFRGPHQTVARAWADKEHDRIDYEAWRKIVDAFTRDEFDRAMVAGIGPGRIVYPPMLEDD